MDKKIEKYSLKKINIIVLNTFVKLNYKIILLNY